MLWHKINKLISLILVLLVCTELYNSRKCFFVAYTQRLLLLLSHLFVYASVALSFLWLLIRLAA